MITEGSTVRSCREADAPRRAYSFERAGTLWMPKGKRLELLGGGPCGSFAARGAASGGYSPLNLPGFAALRSWVTAQRTNSLTFNSVMQKSGTGPPPEVTLSGTPTGLYDPYVAIDTIGGARGTANFKWGVAGSGGAMSATGVLTAASVPLGSTGLTANFEAGTYATDNAYVGKIVQWNDICGQGNHYENALATSGAGLPKVSLAGLNGKPALAFDKVDQDYLRCADSGYCTELCGGEDTPFTSFTVGQIVSGPTAQHVFWSITNTTLSTSEVTLLTATSNWACSKRGDVGSELVSKAGTEDLNPYIFEFVHTGTAVSLLLTNAAGTTTVLNASAQDANSLVVSEAFLGAVRSGANIYSDVLIGEDLKYVGALDAATRGAIRGYLRRQWGL